MSFFKFFIFILSLQNAHVLLSVEINQHKNTKIFLTSIPKCGTWLLDKCINLLTKKNNGLWKYYEEGILRKPLAPENALQLITPSINVLNYCLKNLKDNEYLISHMVFNKKYEKELNKNNFKVIFIIRDPRDQLISRIFYTYKNPQMYPGLQHLSFDELLLGYMGVNTLPYQLFVKAQIQSNI